MRIFAILLVLALAGGGAFYMLYGRQVPVETVTVSRGTMADTVYASGVIEPVTWAGVTAIQRQRVIAHCGCEGETVTRGDLLVSLDDSEGRAQLRALEVTADLARRELERARDLLARRILSQQEFDRTEAQLASAEASLAAQQERLSDYRILTPLDGVVLRLDVEVGEIAEPGKVLLWVGEPRPLQVIAEVNEEDIPRVEPGQRVLLRSDAFPDRVLEAEVASITPKGDPDLKTYRVRLSLPDDTPLLVGMTVDVNIIIATLEDVLLVPAVALDGTSLVVAEDGRAVRRTVEVGLRGLEQAEIRSGLEAGERVVSPLPPDLQDGTPLRVAD